MAWSRTFDCDCGNRFNVVTLRRHDKFSALCNVCGATPGERLAAPSVNRGAVESHSLAVPTNKTKAIDLAMQTITQDAGVTNMRSSVKEGEAAAIPVPEPKGMGWMNAQSAMATVGSDPLNRYNGGLLDHMSSAPGKYVGQGKQHHMKPVEREAKK